MTQVPEWSFLARPLAIAAGVVWLTVFAIFIYRNRKSVLDWTKKVEPSHLLIVALSGVIIFAVIALAAAIWQWNRGDALKQQVASQQIEIKNLQNGLAKALSSRQASSAPTQEQKDTITAPLRDTIKQLTDSNAEKDRQITAKEQQLHRLLQEEQRRQAGQRFPRNPYPDGPIFQRAFLNDEAQSLVGTLRELSKLAYAAQYSGAARTDRDRCT